MGVDREVESLIADGGDPAVARPRPADEPAVEVEIERDPLLVLTPEEADALPPPQVEHLAPFIETQIPSVSPAPEAILPGVTDSTTTFVLGSLVAAVVLALLAVLLARRSSKKRGTDVLLVGPSDAGKTALLAALAHRRTLPTHTSMQPNLAVLPSAKTKTRLVDIPGHARLRAQGLADHLPAARGVLFVVDAAAVARAAPAVAEHLHEVLAALLALPGAAPPPLALVAAKRDLAPQGAARVRAVLERELDRRRQARVDVDAEETKGGLDTVAARGAPFRLAEWEGGEIPVLACSLREKEGDGLAEVREWIEGLD